MIPDRRWAGLLLAWGAALALPACGAVPAGAGGTASGAPASSAAPSASAATASPATSCDARPVQDQVGRHASSLIAEGARQRAGAQRVRMIGHDEMVTKEWDPVRLNLQLDAQGRIARIYCG